MARSDKYADIKPKIKAEYETGHKKAIELSKEYDIPRNTISDWIKKGKWIISEQTNEAINKQIEVTEHLAEQTEQTQEAVKKIVDEKTKHITLVTNVQAYAVSLIGKKMKKEGEDMSMGDLKTGVEATDKAAMTLGVVRRHATGPQVAIQNTNNQIINNTEVTIDMDEEEATNVYLNAIANDKS